MTRSRRVDAVVLRRLVGCVRRRKLDRLDDNGRRRRRGADAGGGNKRRRWKVVEDHVDGAGDSFLYDGLRTVVVARANARSTARPRNAACNHVRHARQNKDWYYKSHYYY